MDNSQVLVGIIMGSQSDWDTMKHAAETLDNLGVPHETRVVSAHRTPDRMFEYAEQAAGRHGDRHLAGPGAGDGCHRWNRGTDASRPVWPHGSHFRRGLAALAEVLAQEDEVRHVFFALGRGLHPP